MPTLEQLEKINSLALGVLNMSRNSLLVNMRFMDTALGRLMFAPMGSEKTSTDGEYFYYDPMYILRSYRREKEFPGRQYLHAIFHCIYRHMFIGTLVNERYWNLACDIAVENSINGLELDTVRISAVPLQNSAIQKLSGRVKYITAEMLYRYFLDNEPSESYLSALEKLFCIDDHEVWYRKDERQGAPSHSNKPQPNNNGEGESQPDQNGKNNQNGGGQDNENNDENNGNGQSQKELEQLWKDVSEYIQTALETLEQKRGTQAGGLTQNLLEVNREKYDYTAFLKKFAVMGEVMKINDDEFDYIFYTYGLQLYEKMPLIEPLEYKDVKRIREFVIAIDTSGSVSGELVQRFVQKTYNILKSSESFFSKINLHIIQCDAEIQEDVKITTQEEFDNYLKNMQLRGFGGTDFRPVFSYVNTLIKNHEFTNLKGLIYFTDGFGTFPERQPDYHTAFVYINDGYENPDVPVWAIKLVLQPEEI